MGGRIAMIERNCRRCDSKMKRETKLKRTEGGHSAQTEELSEATRLTGDNEGGC